MSLEVGEYFGFATNDPSPEAIQAKSSSYCGVLQSTCKKKFSDGSVNGVCSVGATGQGLVCVCPFRLLGKGYTVLKDICSLAFETDCNLVFPTPEPRFRKDGTDVVVLGKPFTPEIRLPGRRGRQSYFVDYILARLEPTGALSEFSAVEVQTVDTTGSYRPAVEALRRGDIESLKSQAGINWENVNKRILPQLIYKGHLLRRESRCPKGLFFVCPSPVYERVIARLGNELESQFPSYGTVTFAWYDLNREMGVQRCGTFTTTVDQIAQAFVAPTGMPPADTYELAIRYALELHLGLSQD
jgi:hypothetical protein